MSDVLDSRDLLDELKTLNKEEATDIAMSVDPDTSEVLEVTSTTAEPLTETEKYLNDPLGKEVS